MSAVFAKLFVQAEKTFSVINKEQFAVNLLALRKLTDNLHNLQDLGLDDFFSTAAAFTGKNKAPTTYINIFDGSKFSMSCFILNDKYKMPLHDHPRMLGLLKVISGKLKIQSYSRCSQEGDPILVTAETPKILDSDSPASFLDENNSNYHEITALDGVAAFFDILAPPYSDIEDNGPDARHCSFYKKTFVSADRKMLRLEKIECPDHYFCDSIRYNKPDFLNEVSS